MRHWCTTADICSTSVSSFFGVTANWIKPDILERKLKAFKEFNVSAVCVDEENHIDVNELSFVTIDYSDSEDNETSAVCMPYPQFSGYNRCQKSNEGQFYSVMPQ